MKIMAPLSPAFDLGRLSTAGADGFYFGFVPTDWLKQFDNAFHLNRRGHNLQANFTEDNVACMLTEAHVFQKHAYVTFNNHQYTREELPIIHESVLALRGMGLDGVIASDINLIVFCHQQGIPVHLSTCATTYNRHSCEFFHSLGISHIILPRDMSLTEMGSIIQNTDKSIEYEAFVYNSPCRFSESVCLSNHGLYGNVCKRIRVESQKVVKMNSEQDYVDYYSNNRLGTCALCQLFQMNSIGIKWLKIVERTLPFTAIETSCMKVKQALLDLSLYDDEEAYCEHIRTQNNCSDFKNCYYR